MYFDDNGLSEVPYVYLPIIEGRLYEEPFLEYIRSLHAVGQYIDVGAHLGTHTIWFAAMCDSSHVHSFEPVSRYAEIAAANVSANSLELKVTIHRIGLGAQPGRASNYLSPSHQLGFSHDPQQGVTEEFDVVRLDDEIQGAVAVMKLDVEGMELGVLQGAERILSQDKPAIFVEAHTSFSVRDIAQFLARFGYRKSGRVFNASPTYEFVAQPKKLREYFVPAYYKTLPVVNRIRNKSIHMLKTKATRL